MCEGSKSKTWGVDVEVHTVAVWGVDEEVVVLSSPETPDSARTAPVTAKVRKKKRRMQ
jgi:hypothetical protein